MLKSLFVLYANPPSAFSRILDRGRLWLAALSAFVVSYLLHWGDIPARATPLARFISYAPGSYAAPLFLLAIVVVPAIILIRAIAGFGSFSMMIQDDYAPLLMCALMSWAAAYLPLTILHLAGIDLVPGVYLAINLYALILTAFAVRTVYGAGYASALGVTVVGWCAGAAGAFLLVIVGGALYFLMSPLVLYYIYIRFGAHLTGFDAILMRRQHFKNQLEIATRNPHDADAHYQLGLIYQQRRQLSEAAARFQTAAKIDPTLAEAYFQLGVIAREQNRLEDALENLRKAANLDDRLAQSDVWRELGATYFASGKYEDAALALSKYVSRREYDPEGLYWYGKTLKQLGQPEAREMFERAIEAVRTMPSHRRAQARQWASRAKAEL